MLKVKTDNVTDSNTVMLIELLAAHRAEVGLLCKRYHADGAPKKRPESFTILLKAYEDNGGLGLGSLSHQPGAMILQHSQHNILR